jgi:hypothetical protein
MYAEGFGIANASAPIESAAMYLQWVQSEILNSATDNDSVIRYNLNQFWQAKADYYPIADQNERAMLDRLDSYAYGFWNALETAKIYTSSPSYWDFWKKFWIGGTPDRPEAMQAATAAAAAAEGQKNAAQRAAEENPKNNSFAAGFTALAKANVAAAPKDLAQATGIWSQTGMEPLGIPLWTWGIGAAALVLLLSRK